MAASDTDVSSLLLLLPILLFSPFSIEVAAVLLAINLLFAVFVKLTAALNVLSASLSLFPPAFQKPNLNAFSLIFDALHVANTADLASKLAELQTRESILAIKEAVIKNGEHALKQAQREISRRLHDLAEDEKDFEFRSKACRLKSRQATGIIEARTRMRMKNVAKHTPSSQMKPKSALNKRKEECIGQWHDRHGRETGDLKTIKGLHEIKYKAPGFVKVSEIKQRMSDGKVHRAVFGYVNLHMTEEVAQVKNGFGVSGLLVLQSMECGDGWRCSGDLLVSGVVLCFDP